jgi:hypothetical protein
MLSLFQPAVFTRHFPVTGSNNGYSSASGLMFSLKDDSLPASLIRRNPHFQQYLYRCMLPVAAGTCRYVVTGLHVTVCCSAELILTYHTLWYHKQGDSNWHLYLCETFEVLDKFLFYFGTCILTNF